MRDPIKFYVPENSEQKVIELTTKYITDRLPKARPRSSNIYAEHTLKCEINAFMNNAIILAKMTDGKVFLRGSQLPIWLRWVIFVKIDDTPYMFTTHGRGYVIITKLKKHGEAPRTVSKR